MPIRSTSTRFNPRFSRESRSRADRPGGRSPSETGFKDTVIAYPEEITHVKATFHVPGFFVWHWHIVEDEDNEMMRPYLVGPMP